MSYPVSKKLFMGAGALVLALSISGCDEDTKKEFTEAVDAYLEGSADANTNMAQLSWLAPTEQVNGEALQIHRVKEYVIYYGQDPVNLDSSITLNDDNTGRMEYAVKELDAGEWYFTVRAVDVDGKESTLSPMVSKEI